MTIGVLCLQGAFAEHEARLKELGAQAAELRSAEDLQQPLDGLILPGGESTTMGKLLRDLDMLVFDMQDVGSRYFTYASTLLCTISREENSVKISCLANSLCKELSDSHYTLSTKTCYTNISFHSSSSYLSLLSLITPRGNSLSIFSSRKSSESIAERPQLVGQLVTISTSEYPLPSI